MMMNDGLCVVVGLLLTAIDDYDDDHFRTHFSKVFFCPLGLSRCCGPYFLPLPKLTKKKKNEPAMMADFFLFFKQFFKHKFFPPAFFFLTDEFCFFFIISNYTCPLLLLLYTLVLIKKNRF